MAERPNKSIYIAGPMRGYPSFNYPAFHAAAARFQALGWQTLDPAEMTRRIDNWDPDGSAPHMPFAHVIKRDLSSVLSVNSVALLPGWAKSEGAQIEVWVAKAIGNTFYDAETLQPITLEEEVVCHGVGVSPRPGFPDPSVVRQTLQKIIDAHALNLSAPSLTIPLSSWIALQIRFAQAIDCPIYDEVTQARLLNLPVIKTSIQKIQKVPLTPPASKHLL